MVSLRGQALEHIILLAEYLHALQGLGEELKNTLAKGAFEELDGLLEYRDKIIQDMASLPLEQRHLSAEQQIVFEHIQAQMRLLFESLEAERQDILKQQSALHKSSQAVATYQTDEKPPAHFIEEES